jgi:hypothetical protein
MLLNGAERLFSLSSGFFTLFPGRGSKPYESSLPQIPQKSGHGNFRFSPVQFVTTAYKVYQLVNSTFPVQERPRQAPHFVKLKLSAERFFRPQSQSAGQAQQPWPQSERIGKNDLTTIQLLF